MRADTCITILIILLLFAIGCEDGGSPSSTSKNPRISGIRPPAAGSGVQITITGSNFGDEQGSGTVKVADKEAAVVSWSVGEIVCTLPQGLSESGGVAVKVTTDSGKAASSQIEITSPNTYRVTIDHAMDQYPCWSGNDRIYFSSTRSGGANWDIYYIPSTGGKAERVTSDDAPDFYPAIRQSSGELAWSSQMRHVNNTEGDYEIFYGFPRCDGPGGACTVAMLTSNESRDLDPTYATTIYSGYYMASTYEEVDAGGSYLAWKIHLHTIGPPVELTEGQHPSFSGNGRWIVYTHESNIYKIPTDGDTPTQLTFDGTDTYPDWGSSNDRIVFQRRNSGNFEDIFIMNADGTDVQPLVSTRNDECYPCWSPDCTKFAYHALVSGNYDIYVYVMP